MVDGRILNRIVVWPTYEDAAAAEAAAGDSNCKRSSKLTVWPTYEQAAAHTSVEDGGGGDVLPDGAIALYDFKNSVYDAGSGSLALAEVLGDSVLFAGTFHPARVVDGVGLIADASESITLIGAALASAQADIAVLLEGTLGVNSTVKIEFVSSDFATDMVAQVTTLGLAQTSLTDGNGAVTGLFTDNPSTGAFKFAFTLADAASIAALNGDLLLNEVDESVIGPIVIDTFAEAIFNIGGDAVLERIVVYPVKNGGELQVLSGGSGGGGDEPLAVIDFAGGVYTVGVTSHAVTDLLVGGSFDAGEISGADGWFPQDDRYPSFGAPLASVFSDAAGVVIVLDAACVSPFESSMQLALAGENVDEEVKSATLNWNSPDLGSLLELAGNALADTASIADVTGRTKIAVKASPAEFAINATGGAPDIVALSAPYGPIDVSNGSTYIEAGTTASFKIYSIKFYAADADLAALVL